VQVTDSTQKQRAEHDHSALLDLAEEQSPRCAPAPIHSALAVVVLVFDEAAQELLAA
jgi:hypothetical protein